MKLTARELDVLLITIINDKKGKKAGDFKLIAKIKEKLRKPLLDAPKAKEGQELTKEIMDEMQREREVFANTEFEVDISDGELLKIQEIFSRFDDFSSRDEVEKLVLTLSEKLGL